ncbi:MAG: YciI family protein, partial [Alphaproteobacteria bacterium]
TAPSWKEMIATASQKGMLAKQLFVVFTEPTGDLDKVQESRADHLKYQVEIEQKGIMFAAGPLADDSGEAWGGDGMIIIRADSLEAATRIAEADPMHASGARKFHIRPWLMNEGGFNLRVTFSDGKQRIE